MFISFWVHKIKNVLLIIMPQTKIYKTQWFTGSARVLENNQPILKVVGSDNISKEQNLLMFVSVNQGSGWQ